MFGSALAGCHGGEVLSDVLSWAGWPAQEEVQRCGALQRWFDRI